MFPEETGEEKSVIKSGIEESCQRDKELNQKMKRADDDLKQYEKARETEEKLRHIEEQMSADEERLKEERISCCWREKRRRRRSVPGAVNFRRQTKGKRRNSLNIWKTR